MIEFTFPALSTVWNITVDHPDFSEKQREGLRQKAADFEERYSRFRSNSEVSRLVKNFDPATVSAPLSEMLELGEKLARITDGYFSLKLRPLLESLGYGKKSDGPQLDLGALGKGYLIDQLTNSLIGHGYRHFLVEGGGDMRAMAKASGQPWTVLLEHPTDTSQAFGQLKLGNQSLATSSSQRRRFGDFHHLVNPKTKRPTNNVLSVSALASTALFADAGATALFVSPQSYWSEIRHLLQLEYLVVLPDLSYLISAEFPDFTL